MKNRPTPDRARRDPPRCLGSEIDPHVLRDLVRIALDLAAHGCEGRPVGTMFVIGDEDEVMRRSHALILDPLAGHAPAAKSIFDPGVQGTVKELALLDGAFVVSATGVVVSAARCLDVATSDVEVPLGLGSRHQAAASMTRVTEAMAVVLSESSTVRLFHDGEIADEMAPTGSRPRYCSTPSSG